MNTIKTKAVKGQGGNQHNESKLQTKVFKGQGPNQHNESVLKAH